MPSWRLKARLQLMCLIAYGIPLGVWVGDRHPLDVERLSDRPPVSVRVGDGDELERLKLTVDRREVSCLARCAVRHPSIESRVETDILGEIENTVVPGNRFVHEAPGGLDGSGLDGAVGRNGYLEDVAVGFASVREVLLARDPAAPGHAASRAVGGRSAEDGEAPNEPPIVYDELGAAGVEQGVGVVAPIRRNDHIYLIGVSLGPAVLVVANEDRVAVPAPERGHAVEARRSGVPIVHDLALARDDPVPEIARQENRPPMSTSGP